MGPLMAHKQLVKDTLLIACKGGASNPPTAMDGIFLCADKNSFVLPVFCVFHMPLVCWIMTSIFNTTHEFFHLPDAVENVTFNHVTCFKLSNFSILLCLIIISYGHRGNWSWPSTLNLIFQHLNLRALRWNLKNTICIKG